MMTTVNDTVYWKVAKILNVLIVHVHKDNYEVADVFTNLIVIISQYIGVSNHCMVHLNVIHLLYLKTGEKIMAKRVGGWGRI